MAKSKRKSGKAARAAASAVIKKRGSSPETSDTDLEAVDSNEVRWEPLVIKEHYEGTDRQMTPSQQLLGGEEGDFDEDTLQFLTKWKDTDTGKWSHDRHDTWEPAESFMESSNAVIKYLDRHPELEQHPQMVKFKARRDLRRQRRISYINERTAKRQSQANDDSDAEDEPVASTVSPKKTKVTSTKESPAKKKKLKAATPPSDRETKEQAEDEPASDDLPTPIDITKPSSSPSKAKKALPKKVHGKMAAASKATAQAEDSETTESAATAKTLQPATDDDDDDFDALNLAPKGATIITGESSPPPASSPPRQAASVVPKEKRKAASQLFKQAGSSDDEQTQPAKKQKVSDPSSADEEAATESSAKGANANGKSVSPAPKAGATEKKQVFKDLLASNWVRKSKDDGATPAKKSADSKDILTYSQTPDEESEDKQKLADALVNLKTAYIGDKNVRSHAKVTKMVSRFWKVTRKIKLEGADEATQSQTQQSNTGAPPVLHSLLKDKKAGIFLIKRPVVDQKHLDQDVMALQLLALASEAAEVGALSEDMMTDLAQLSIVFIHCSSLSRPGDMERLVNDPLLNRLRVEAPHVRFIVFGMRFTGAEKTPTGVFEPIFDSRNAITFTSEVILHHTPAWQERAKKAHELWPSISMYMHPALIPKTAELSTGTITSIAEEVGGLFTIKAINAAGLGDSLSAGLGDSIDDMTALDFPAKEDERKIEDCTDSRALRPAEEVKEIVKLVQKLRCKYFKVRRWIIVASPTELEKLKTDYKDNDSVEFMDLEGLDPVIAEYEADAADVEMTE